MYIEDKLELKAYVTNLGKYTEGELVGEWVTFPIAQDELNQVLERIGIGTRGEYGQSYDEYFITDYDGNLPKAVFDELGEYPSIEKLQVFGEVFNQINELGEQGRDIFEGLTEQFSFMDAAENLLNDRAYFMEGVGNNYDLGEYIVREFYEDGETFPRDKAELYFDYEKFGQAVREDYDAYNEDTVQDYLGLDDYADDEEIGQAYVDQVYGSLSAIDGIKDFIDYDFFGRDCDLEGQFVYVNGGAVDYCNCEENGEDLYEEIKDRLIDDGILPKPERDLSKNPFSKEARARWRAENER